MKFKLFIQALEKNLGYHHIPFNRDASTLQNLFDGTPVQSEFVIKLVRAIYKKNHCSSINADITKTVTEKCLATIRLTTLQSNNTDVDTFNFIEDLCLAIDAIFKEDNETYETQQTKETRTDQQDDESNVVSIEHKRHRRWLKSSA